METKIIHMEEASVALDLLISELAKLRGVLNAVSARYRLRESRLDLMPSPGFFTKLFGESVERRELDKIRGESAVEAGELAACQSGVHVCLDELYKFRLNFSNTVAVEHPKRRRMRKSDVQASEAVEAKTPPVKEEKNENPFPPGVVSDISEVKTDDVPTVIGSGHNPDIHKVLADVALSIVEEKVKEERPILPPKDEAVKAVEIVKDTPAEEKPVFSIASPGQTPVPYEKFKEAAKGYSIVRPSIGSEPAVVDVSHGEGVGRKDISDVDAENWVRAGDMAKLVNTSGQHIREKAEALQKETPSCRRLIKDDTGNRFYVRRDDIHRYRFTNEQLRKNEILSYYGSEEKAAFAIGVEQKDIDDYVKLGFESDASGAVSPARRKITGALGALNSDTSIVSLSRIKPGTRFKFFTASMNGLCTRSHRVKGSKMSIKHLKFGSDPINQLGDFLSTEFTYERNIRTSYMLTYYDKCENKTARFALFTDSLPGYEYKVKILSYSAPTPLPKRQGCVEMVQKELALSV